MSPDALRIGYQGEPGAYSQQAVETLFPDAEPVPIRTLRRVFEAVEGGELAHGVVPLENSLAGSINEAYDLLSAGHAFVVGEVVVSVDHSLLALPGTKMEDLKRVCSHPQALAQCEEFLAMLDVDLVPVYDTAGAAKKIADERRAGEAAVASENAARIYGLEVLARHIQTSPQNQTRFAAIGPRLEPLAPPDKTSLLLELRHVPGSLYRCLRPFAERDLNLTKLESRPRGDRPWEYWFYLDVQAGVGDPALSRHWRRPRGTPAGCRSSAPTLAGRNQTDSRTSSGSTGARQRRAIGPERIALPAHEPELVGWPSPYRPSAIVDPAMMRSAQKRQVLQRSLPAVRPVPYVVSVQEPTRPASRKGAAPIAQHQ